tara:strand:+ start:664 stop:1002 length:339 start_codon:yes stop_codon:yes gene_type:complete
VVDLHTMRFIVLVSMLFALQFLVALLAYAENRMRPLMLELHLLRDDVEELHLCARYYAEKYGISPPPELLVPPESQLTKPLRMMRLRMMVEVGLIAMVASLPSGAVYLSIGQ